MAHRGCLVLRGERSGRYQKDGSRSYSHDIKYRLHLHYGWSIFRADYGPTFTLNDALPQSWTFMVLRRVLVSGRRALATSSEGYNFWDHNQPLTLWFRWSVRSRGRGCPHQRHFQPIAGFIRTDKEWVVLAMEESGFNPTWSDMQEFKEVGLKARNKYQWKKYQQ